MNFSILSINEGRERFETVRPKHLEALIGIIRLLSSWKENDFFDALDDLGWREKRIPLRIFQAERADWEIKYQILPYRKPRYAFCSSQWKQELWSLFFAGKGRFVYAGKKGMGLIAAVGALDHALRSIYTDFPLLYDMDKIGAGVLVISQKEQEAVQAALKTFTPLTALPVIVLVVSD